MTQDKRPGSAHTAKATARTRSADTTMIGDDRRTLKPMVDAVTFDAGFRFRAQTMRRSPASWLERCDDNYA